MPVIVAKIKVGVGGQGDDDQIQPLVSKDLRNKIFFSPANPLTLFRL